MASASSSMNVHHEEDDELLHSQAHIWNQIFNFINSMSLKCAIQLGIPDAVHRHGRPITLPELIAALPVHPPKARCVHRLMRILTHSGFFIKHTLKNDAVTEEDDDSSAATAYSLAPAARLLLKDEPMSVTPFLLAMLDPILINPWHDLGRWFQNDDPTPFDTAHGRTLWDFAGTEPQLNLFFNDAMASDARLVAGVVIRNYPEVFDGVGSLVDVGGGTGTVAKAIADAFPKMDCTVLDLPHVVADLNGSKNLKYVGGDMFEAIPPADAVLLKWILHDWNDEECVKILKKCKEAIPSRQNGGKVIIIDMTVQNNNVKGGATSIGGLDKSFETQLFFDMLMMVVVTGRERSRKDWAKLFSDAGFSDYKITPILGLRSLIEVYP